jgi:hypothetical protein
MRIGLFPGQEEALRNEINRLHMLGRRRFLYLGIGVLVGGSSGLLLGKTLATRAPSGDVPTSDHELVIALQAVAGSQELLRSQAVLVIGKAYEYPSHPRLRTGLLRLTELVVADPPSSERQLLARFLFMAFQQSSDFAQLRGTDLIRRLAEAASGR